MGSPTSSSGRRAIRAAGKERTSPTPPPSRLPQTGLPATTTGLLGARQTENPYSHLPRKNRAVSTLAEPRPLGFLDP